MDRFKISFYILLGFLQLGFNTVVFAQSDDVVLTHIDTVVITSSRIHTPYLNAPISVTPIDLKQSSKYISHSDLSEALNAVPGLFTLDGQNYAQDLRISLRGFGARSAFGIRGIKLIVDGIPETTPDGQGQLDNISVGDITSIEVLQSTSGSQYGNAAGGVISINTLSDDVYRAKVGLRVGSYGLREHHLSTSIQQDNTLMQLGGTHQRSTGYRDHSGVIQTNLLSKLTHRWGSSKIIWQASYLNSPKAQDPGGINIDQAIERPSSARDRNILFNSGEELSHWKTSLRYVAKISDQVDGDVSAFYSGRNFDGRLPFSFGGAIDLNRKYGGLMGQLNYKKVTPSSVNKLSLGFEYLSQRDSRDRFMNEEGVRGMMTLSQIEKFDNLGIYLIDQWQLANWTVSGSLRYDHNKIGIEDLFLTNGDAGGAQSLSSVNYSLGISYRLQNNQSIFASWSTSFETPVLSELGANPTGGGGFNDMLDPMRSKTLEVGLRGYGQNNLKYSFSIFNINSQDEFIPFELGDFPGRTFYRNAGSTKRLGIESSFSFQLVKALNANVSYTLSNFTFDDYLVDGEDLSGNHLPGIPNHNLSTSIVFEKNNTFAKLTSQYFSSITVRDDNSVTVDPYHVMHLRLGHELVTNTSAYAFFIGINNLLSETYFDNLRLNAFGSRHYEPAAPTNFQVGVTVELD